MKSHERKRDLLLKRGLAGCLALACVLSGLVGTAPVMAGGAQPILPGSSSLRPDAGTPIQMSSEVVTITIRQATEKDNTLLLLTPNYYGFQRLPVWYPGVAEVTADFTLKNPTSQVVSMKAWYPMANLMDAVDWNLSPSERMARIQEFEAYIDGAPSNAMVSELPNPRGAEKPALPWANFPVTIPAGKETVVQIRTKFPLQPSISGIEMTLYHVFNTAAGWAGPIGKAELIVNLPYPASTETLAGIPAGVLRVPPYYRPSQRADLPAGAVLEGNQARWTWKDLEPGGQDDLALWLIQPAQWEALKSARAAVQANAGNGQAWLDLGYAYYSLSSSGPGWPTVFGTIYLPQGIAAYKKAAVLLPERSATHAGLGLLTLELYTANGNAPPEAIQTVRDELQTARALEAQNPTIEKETGRTRWLLSALETEWTTAFPGEATATVGEAAHDARITETAPVPTPSATATRKPISSMTPIPTATIMPTSTEATGRGQSTVLLLAGCVLVLAAAGILLLSRKRKSGGPP